MSALPFGEQTSSESSFDVEHITLTLKAGVCLSSGKSRGRMGFKAICLYQCLAHDEGSKHASHY